MSNNNHQNPVCRFAEQIVSYLYDEAAAGERIKFEAHLKGCSACADELANFGAVRSSILEWRDADFSNLAVPSFSIPMTEKETTSPAAATSSDSWFDRIRKMFSFNPALAAAALAIAVVGIGIALFGLNFSGGDETAAVENKNAATKPVVSPTVEITKKSEENNDGEKVEKAASRSFERTTSPKETNSNKSISTEKAAVKVSTNAAKSNSGDQAVAPKEPIDKKSAPVKKQRVPNLNEADDDEDKTIRLADLFDELDTK